MAYKWGSPPQSRTVAFYQRRVGELVQERLKASGLSWEEGQEPYRFLDDSWVRGHADTPLADEPYRIGQRGSVLEGRGAGVTRAEMDEIRAKRAAT
jgi:hypothetical protein